MLSWNILSGGRARADRILAAIRSHNPDVVVLQETMDSAKQVLCDPLRALGWKFGLSSSRGARAKGVCVLSSIPLRRYPSPICAATHERGWVEFEIEGLPIRFSALHAPSTAAALPHYWKGVAGWASEVNHERRVLLGDMNVGVSGIDAENYSFKGADGFSRLQAVGFVDLWRGEHGARQEYTWYSAPRRDGTRRGFRIDHALATQTVIGPDWRCSYSHSERLEEISDHSILLLDL